MYGIYVSALLKQDSRWVSGILCTILQFYVFSLIISWVIELHVDCRISSVRNWEMLNIKPNSKQFYHVVMKNLNKSLLLSTKLSPTPWVGKLYHTFADRMGHKTESLPQIIHLVLLKKHRRQETEALMKDYGGINPLILLYFCYFSMSLVLPVSVITASS